MSAASADGVHAVNQRDLGTVLPHLIQQGIFFRASMQHEFPATATATGTIIDLRRPPKPTAGSPPPPPSRSGARNTINVNMVPTGTGLRLVAKLPFSKSLPVCMVPERARTRQHAQSKRVLRCLPGEDNGAVRLLRSSAVAYWRR